MHRYFAQVICLSALLIFSGPDVQAESKTSFVIAVGEAGSESFAIGTGLWMLSQVELLRDHGMTLEIAEAPKESDRLNMLHDERLHFALVEGQVPSLFAEHARAVMTLRQKGVSEVDVETAQLLVRADVSDDVVYRITSMIFEHAIKLDHFSATMGIESPRKAVAGLSLPIHPGAYRYYEEQGLGFIEDAPSTPRLTEGAQFYGAVGQVTLSADEVVQLAAACRDAAARGALDLFDDENFAELCGDYSVEGTLVGMTDSSNGQGGPEIRAREGNGTDRPTNASRDDPSSKMHGHPPTM